MPDDLISKRPTFDRARIMSQSSSLLFSISMVVFVLVLVVWGGLYFYKRSLDANVANWQDQVNSLESELRPDLLDQLIALSNKLSATREVLSNHIFSSNTLTLLERDTHPQVALTSFQYSSDGRKLDVSAKAASYHVVADQISLLEADPQVESVNFGGLQLDDKGLVSFKLAIIFKPNLLRLRPQQ